MPTKSRVLNKTYGPPPDELAARMIAERERLGLSQAEAARRLGVARAVVRSLESAPNPTLATLVALVEVLGYDGRRLVPELFAGPRAGTESGTESARKPPEFPENSASGTKTRGRKPQK